MFIHIWYIILRLQYFQLCLLTLCIKSERSIQPIVYVHLLPCIANLYVSTQWQHVTSRPIY
jgi:C4-dicarboxylate transporter